MSDLGLASGWGQMASLSEYEPIIPSSLVDRTNKHQTGDLVSFKITRMRRHVNAISAIEGYGNEPHHTSENDFIPSIIESVILFLPGLA